MAENTNNQILKSLTYRTYSRMGFHDNQLFEVEDDDLAVETAVSIIYNEIAHTVQMCTASDLEDLAVGFSVTEGIVESAKDIYDIEMIELENGIELHVELPTRYFEGLKRARRNLAGRTGCGICGTESLQHVVRDLVPVTKDTHLNYRAVERVLSQFHQHQFLNQKTGSTHAAAYISPQGEILAIREDVGRHNALDKLLGHYSKSDYQGGAILISSRASFEMVQKVAAANVDILLAISGATSMAVDLAEKLNITLSGYCRTGRMNLYTHPNRIQF